jgi:hypothetical protein
MGTQRPPIGNFARFFANSPLGLRLQKRSPIFQRALLYDGATPRELEQMVQQFRARMPAVAAIVKFMEGQQALGQTVTALLPLLPAYSASTRTLTQLLEDDVGKRTLVAQLLRRATPFTSLDRTVEDQQELRTRRDQFLLIEVPGGPDGPVGQLLQQEGIVTDCNQLLEAGEEEIRLYYLREGLPYGVVRPLQKYQERYTRYCTRPGSITPHTVRQGQQFPPLAPPQHSLRARTERLLWVTKAVRPARLAVRPSGGFLLHYEADTGHGFATTQEEPFADFPTLLSWMAQRAPVRRALRRELAQALDADPQGYIAALRSAYHGATGAEREHLQQELFRLHVDPSQFPTGVNGPVGPKGIPVDLGQTPQPAERSQPVAPLGRPQPTHP